MDEKKRHESPDYGVRLSGDELADHQQKFQQNTSESGTEYGPQGQQDQQPSSEYGPQGGFQPPQPPVGHQQGYQPPGFQHPGSTQQGPQPGFQQPAQPYGHAYGQPMGGPQLSADMTREPKRPRVLDVSFWAIIAAGISYLISQLIIVSLPNRGLSNQDIDMMESMMASMGDPVPFESAEAYLNSSLMTAVMVGQAIIFAIAYLLVGLGIRNGWRSMRILGTVFAALSLFNLSFASPLVGVFSGLAIILGIVGIVYAWLPASTEYYRHKAWQKAAKKAYPNAASR